MRGRLCPSEIPLSSPNLRPFGAPPSMGRRERPREPLPLEGAAERSEAGLAFFFGRRSRLLFAFPIGKGVVSRKAVFSYRSLPHRGRGTASAVDRVLSYIVDLRRSPSLFFIPLLPYPARSARHLPHAGKAVILKYRFSPSNLRPFGAPPSIGRRECPREPLPLEGAAERSEAGLAYFFAAKPPPLCLPHWGRGTASAVDRVLSYIVDLRCIFPLFFMPLVPYPARSARHLPQAGKAVLRRNGVLVSSSIPRKNDRLLRAVVFFVYYLLKETLIKSQNSISHGS